MPDIDIAVVFPDLLGTYGDGGNAVVLAQRLRWRGISATVTEVKAGDAVPDSCSIYVLGGGEDHGLLATFPASVRVPAPFVVVGRVLAVADDEGPLVLVGGETPTVRPGWDHFGG